MNRSAGAGRVGVIVVAAGSGSRLGAVLPKALVPLAGQPILGHALRGVLACPGLMAVVVVAPAGHRPETETACRDAVSRYAATLSGDPMPPTRVAPTVVTGGAERSDSVAAGLAALPAEVDIVLVHDAARCLTPVVVFERVVAAVRSGAPAVVPGMLVVDTIKQVDAAGRVVATPARAALRTIQTPQGFRRDVLERAHALGGTATDDAALVERLGEPVLVVDGDPLSLKITTRADLDAATRLLTP
ncbi:2-C-methyl-D-erythritol 4-phosphate cytidylyltransferase [Humibacillus sp. DSM 29435]|uniref:2-C-methyl-D-erythritol 4-phosphate cytidylyltransferase n=1 Tax=Humibacillus sp. DSM 29435 TaxID=1869167 RepID=UPI000872B3BC|nr:2-C-methyl-D-erythritol 4-phosphate cytidylyltransferase [Humibacillus sp. DSM 29435]OFE15863.1 2-C-methyl-D-erythritol 4-phosphate cytidylyltransferase [Humibacillus sp. DSM 29435]